MTFTLTIAAVAAVIACYVAATRNSAMHPAVAGVGPVGLADPAAETVGGGANVQPGITAPGQWQVTTVDNLSTAEDMLDLLEARGFGDRELIVMGNRCFAIRWR